MIKIQIIFTIICIFILITSCIPANKDTIDAQEIGVTEIVQMKFGRLTIINKSCYFLSITLDGSEFSNQTYFLKIPAGSKSKPTVRPLTILEDKYTRTTTYFDSKNNQIDETVEKIDKIKNTYLIFQPCKDS